MASKVRFVGTRYWKRKPGEAEQEIFHNYCSEGLKLNSVYTVLQRMPNGFLLLVERQKISPVEALWGEHLPYREDFFMEVK